MQKPRFVRLGVVRALCAVALVLLALGAVPQRARAADASQTKTVKVGWLVNNEGFQEGTPGGYLTGWGYEYLQTLSYYTPGWRYEYVSGTFSELMQKLENGEIDLMPNISYTEERAQKLLFSSNPEGTEHYYIMAKPSRDDLATGDPKALEGKTIGCNDPSVMQVQAAQGWLAEKGVSCNYRYYETADGLFSALSDDEVDAIVMNDTISSADAAPIFSVGSSDYYLVTPKSRQDLMDDINAAMTALTSVNPRYNDEVKGGFSVDDSGSASLSGRERSWLKKHGNTIVVGYLTNKLPYCDEESDGRMGGSLAALVKTLERRFGITVRAKAFDSNGDAAKALERGEIDVAMPVFRDYWLAEQDGSIQSSSLASVSLAMVYSGADPSEAVKSIAYSKSSLVNGNALKVLYPQSETLRRDSTEQALQAVRDGKASCMVTLSSSLETLREQYDLDGLSTTELPKTAELSCWMRRGNAELLGIVNKGIVNAGNSIAAANYVPSSYSAQESEVLKFIYRNRATIIAAVICVLLGVVTLLVWALLRARAAQRKAQAANAAKTNFLTRMSHDIRTPLNGIMGLIEVDELHPDDTELARQNRVKARVAANHLLSLINDILEMGKIEDRKVVLERVPFNLDDLAHDVFVLGQIRASERGITMTSDHARELIYPYVIGSPTHVRQIILNLTDNCIKYNKPGGTVRCTSALERVEGDTGTYRLQISDTGIGMSPEFLEHIYEPFAQAGDDARSKFQGTGMGMPIVKSLVEMMGGTIEVESELGVGTTFTVHLPLTIDRHPQDHQATEEELPAGSLEGMNILLAEDNDLNAEIAQALLESEGISVVRAKDGQEAYDLYLGRAAGSFDAILMDVMMPGMNGYDAARAIRRSDKLDAADIPIIAMTANAFAEDIADAKAAGMNAHVAKPIDLAILKATLASVR